MLELKSEVITSGVPLNGPPNLNTDRAQKGPSVDEGFLSERTKRKPTCFTVTAEGNSAMCGMPPGVSTSFWRTTKTGPPPSAAVSGCGVSFRSLMNCTNLIQRIAGRRQALMIAVDNQ